MNTIPLTYNMMIIITNDHNQHSAASRVLGFISVMNYMQWGEPNNKNWIKESMSSIQNQDWIPTNYSNYFLRYTNIVGVWLDNEETTYTSKITVYVSKQIPKRYTALSFDEKFDYNDYIVRIENDQKIPI